MRYEDLSALSPVVRKEVISGELNRRIKAMDVVPTEDLDTIVDTIAGLALTDVVSAIQDPSKLAEQVEHATNALTVSKTSTPSKSPSPPASSAPSREPSALRSPALSAASRASLAVSSRPSLASCPACKRNVAQPWSLGLHY